MRKHEYSLDCRSQCGYIVWWHDKASVADDVGCRPEVGGNARKTTGHRFDKRVGE